MITVRVPCLPPTTNNAFVTVGNRRMLSRDASAFKDLVRWTMLANHERRIPIKGLVEVSLTFYSQRWRIKDGRPRKADVSNLEKLLVDAVFEHLRMDDSAIWKLTLRKLDGPEESVIRIQELQ